MTDEEDLEPQPPAAEASAPQVQPTAPLLAEPAPLLATVPLDGWVKPQRVQRPLLGATLWCFGALFWSYLVVGEIVVWTAAPEALGVIAVLGAFGFAWYRATSQVPQAP